MEERKVSKEREGRGGGGESSGIKKLASRSLELQHHD